MNDTVPGVRKELLHPFKLKQGQIVHKAALNWLNSERFEFKKKIVIVNFETAVNLNKFP